MESLIRNPFGSPAPMRKAYGEALVELGAAARRCGCAQRGCAEFRLQLHV